MDPEKMTLAETLSKLINEVGPDAKYRMNHEDTPLFFNLQAWLDVALELDRGRKGWVEDHSFGIDEHMNVTHLGRLFLIQSATKQ